MSDSFEYSGLWWLPEYSGKKIHGKLSYDITKGTTLSLDGAFQKNPEGNYKIILGETSDGKRITLRNCLRTHLTSSSHPPNSKQYKTSKFLVSIFFIGMHFLKKEDIKFTELSVELSQLEEWLGERPFQERTEEKEGSRQHILEFTMPPTKEITLDKFKISIGYGFSTGMNGWLRPRFEASVRVYIDLDEEMHVDGFFSIVYHLRNFLSLATGNRVLVLTITGRNKNIDEFKGVQIYYRREIDDDELFSFPFFPIEYGSISKHLELYLRNWFDLVENLAPTYDLFFGTMYNPHLYPSHAFLSLAQALESYLSRTSDNKIMPVEMFEEPLSRMLEIINDVPEEYRQQFKPKVRLGMNRKSFRTKLKELFEEYGGLFSSFVDDKDKFIGKVVDTRNYYTHYTPELEARTAKLTDLPFLSQNLRFILIAILLKEIGLDNKLIDLALRKYMRFRIRRVAY